MKRIGLMMVLSGLMILFILAITSTNECEISKDVIIQQKTDSLKIMKEQIQLKDSLHKEHIKSCAWVSKDQVFVNKYGDKFIRPGTNYMTN